MTRILRWTLVKTILLCALIMWGGMMLFMLLACALESEAKIPRGKVLPMRRAS